MSDFNQFGFGQGDEGIGQKSNRFKPEAGKTYRMSFASWPTKVDADGKTVFDFSAISPVFEGAERVFIDKIGFVINPTPEIVRLQTEDKKMAIGTLVCIWPIDENGDLDKARLGKFEIKPWIFAGDKYPPMAKLHKSFHFGNNDLVIDVGTDKYHKLTFRPEPQNVLRQILENPKAADLAAKILAKIELNLPSVKTEIGKLLTFLQIKEKLGGAPVGGNGGGDRAPAGGSNGGGLATGIDLDALLDDVIAN